MRAPVEEEIVGFECCEKGILRTVTNVPDYTGIDTGGSNILAWLSEASWIP